MWGLVCGADLQMPTTPPSRYRPRSMRPFVRSSLPIAMLLSSVALAASHPWSDYDDTRGTWLKGTVRSSAFERPHQTIELVQDGAQLGCGR